MRVHQERFYLTPAEVNTVAYVYILRCSDGSLYTGWTPDLQRRLKAHMDGRASKYTRSRLPVALAACARFETPAAARSFEARFKRMTRAAKLEALRRREAFGVRVHNMERDGYDDRPHRRRITHARGPRQARKGTDLDDQRRSGI